MRPRCIGTNRDGARCTRTPEIDHFLCAFHQTVETPAQSEAIVKNFWREMVAQGRALDSDLVLLVMALGWEDDELRAKFITLIKSEVDERHAHRAKRKPTEPHPSRQKQIARANPDGRYQTPRPDPAAEIEDDDVIFIEGEEIEQ
jgi:hypothetical protein